MANSERENWWTRPCGGREVLVLALPLIISSGSLSVMHFVDRMFLLWHSKEAMAAALPAGLLLLTLVCFPLGVAMYCNAFVAQYKGAGRPERIGLVVWQGARIGLLATPLYLATIPLAPMIFRLAGHEADVAALEVIYYQVLTFGAGGQLVSGALATFFTGRGETRVVMLVDCSAVGLNLVLDYAWIFGHWGFPEMGIEGAAWATVVAQWSRVLIYWWLMMRPVYRQKYQVVEGRRFDGALMRRILRYGGPNGLQFFVDVAAFSLFILLVGRLGEDAMAATTLAFNVNSVAFVPMIGMGIAVTTMVGQQLGRNRPHMAARFCHNVNSGHIPQLGLVHPRSAIRWDIVEIAFQFIQSPETDHAVLHHYRILKRSHKTVGIRPVPVNFRVHREIGRLGRNVSKIHDGRAVFRYGSLPFQFTAPGEHQKAEGKDH